MIRALDLFCGAGGSSCGAQLAGATIVGGIDMWDTAIDTFQLNFPRAKTYRGKLQYLSARQVAHEIGPVDLLLASPECTHHSIVRGARRTDENSMRLAFEVIRFAKALRPRWVVIENVGRMRKWHRYEEWLESLRKLQYNVKPIVLNAHRFGVPQSRSRLYVIGDCEQMPSIPEIVDGNDRRASSIISSHDENGARYRFSPLKSKYRALATLQRAQRGIRAVGATSKFLMVYYGSDAAGGFQRLDRPLRTITTLDRFALVRPNTNGHEMRMLQPPELAAAMGFPTKFSWPQTTRRNKIKLIGNAVCPPVMQAIVETLTGTSSKSAVSAGVPPIQRNKDRKTRKRDLAER